MNQLAVFPIRIFGDPVLRRRAQEVAGIDDDVRKLVRDMVDTMRLASGVGLAAPQIGVMRRVIVWEFDGRSGALINPVITAQEGEVTEFEGCLSLPGLSYRVTRPQRIVVEALDALGQAVREEFEDMPARIVQHEVDHIDGILFIDRLPEELRKEAMRQLREQTLNPERVQQAAGRL